MQKDIFVFFKEGDLNFVYSRKIYSNHRDTTAKALRKFFFKNRFPSTKHFKFFDGTFSQSISRQKKMFDEREDRCQFRRVGRLA